MKNSFMTRKLKRRRVSLVRQVDIFKVTGFNEWDYLQNYFLRR